MNEIELRVPCHLVEPLLEAVAIRDGTERVAFALVSSATTSTRTLLLAHDLVVAPSDAYLDPQGHGGRWSGRFTIEILNRALGGNLGVVILHEHLTLRSRPVGLSRDDRRSAEELLMRFGAVQPHRPHGSVVLGETSAAGMFHVEGRLVQPARFTMRFLRSHLDDRPNQVQQPSSLDPESFDRQILAVGSRGQERLRRATIAVVGLGGGGSHVVQQLAHLGMGRVVGIDADTAEASNRSRLVGLTASDVQEKRPKIKVMEDMVRRISLGTVFEGVQSNVPNPDAIAALRDADVIVGCLDNYHARNDLQQLSWRLLIPYVDIGLVLDPPTEGEAPETDNWIGGQVYTLIPGSACLGCTDYLTDARLAAETGGAGRSYLRNGRAAQVVSFNGVLASQAVNEVLQLVTGFARRKAETSLRKFNGVTGSLELWRIRARPTCARCLSHLAAGDPVWRVA